MRFWWIEAGTLGLLTQAYAQPAWRSACGGAAPGFPESSRPLPCAQLDAPMAAGRLGGALFPTHELKDQQRGEAARHDFGRAIEKRNKLRIHHDRPHLPPARQGLPRHGLGETVSNGVFS